MLNLTQLFRVFTKLTFHMIKLPVILTQYRSEMEIIDYNV